MGKLSKMLYMIDLLNTGNIYTIKQLSEMLGVTERMVRYYKEEICANGIAIESFKGPNGGYFMIDKIKNYTSINRYDLKLLNNIREVLKKTKFEYIKNYEDFIDKAEKTCFIYEEKSKYIINVSNEGTDKIEQVLASAVSKAEKIDIAYVDLDGKSTTRTIHPLYLFKYNGDAYVAAFCELRNDIRQFEIKRIKLIK